MRCSVLLLSTDYEEPTIVSSHLDITLRWIQSSDRKRKWSTVHVQELSFYSFLLLQRFLEVSLVSSVRPDKNSVLSSILNSGLCSVEFEDQMRRAWERYNILHMLAARKSNTDKLSCYGINKVLDVCTCPFWPLPFTIKSLFHVNKSLILHTSK